MKKILSIALTLALVLSVMSVSVLAAGTTYDSSGNAGQYWLVGTQDENAALGEELGNGLKPGTGPNEFDNGSVNSDIKINFNNSSTNNPDIPGNPSDPIGEGDAIEDRYAIDIVYKNLVIDLTNLDNDTVFENDPSDPGDDQVVTLTYVWDVNKHNYVQRLTDEAGNVVTPDDATEEDKIADLLSSEYRIVKAFYVINHSSLAIWYKAKVTPQGNSETAFALDLTNSGVSDVLVDTTNIQEITRATTGAASNENGAISHDLVATPNGDSWLTALNTLAGSLDTGSVVGQLTVTFAATENDTVFN